MKKICLWLTCLVISLGASDGLLDSVRPVVPVKEVEAFKKISAVYDSNKPEALKLLRKLPESRSAVFDYLEGGINLTNREMETALKFFEKSVKKFPDFYKAHLILAGIYLGNNDYDKALKSYSKVVTLGRADGAVWKNLAYINIQQKNYLAAEQAYQNARIFLPKDDSIDQSFVQLRLMQGDFQAALNVASELLDKDTKNQTMWKTVIDCLNNLNRPKEALRHFELYARLFELGENERMQLASLYYNQEQFRDAAAQYAFVQGKQAIAALKNRVVCLNELGDHKAVLNLLDRDLEQVYIKDRELLYIMRADANLNLDQSAKAKQDFEKALEYNSQNAQTLFALAEIAEANENHQEAIRYYELASKDPLYRSAAFMRQARLYLTMELYGLALKAAESAKLSDKSPAVLRFYEQVKKLADQH